MSDAIALFFEPGFGLDPFTPEDIDAAQHDPAVFGLKLKREPGRLYGRAHALLRQSFFNHLPTAQRIHCVSEKLRHFQLTASLLQFLSIKGPLELTDASDIGMGHAVYKLDIHTPNGPSSVVVKNQETQNQSFFCQLLHKWGLPSYRTRHVWQPAHQWQISAYLDGAPLQTYLLENPLETRLVRALGQQAAWGDIFGRGDRHPENYVVCETKLYPVDITYLFWPDNDDWSHKYIAGGLYEINTLVTSGAAFHTHLILFFEAYETAIVSLAHRRQDIQHRIIAYYGAKDAHTMSKVAFVRDRLKAPQDYIAAQRRRYLTALDAYFQRLPFKHKLAHLAMHNPVLMTKKPLLKMYALADADRSSAFFLSEDHDMDLFSEIDRLFRQHAPHEKIRDYQAFRDALAL